MIAILAPQELLHNGRHWESKSRIASLQMERKLIISRNRVCLSVLNLKTKSQKNQAKRRIAKLNPARLNLLAPTLSQKIYLPGGTQRTHRIGLGEFADSDNKNIKLDTAG